MKIPREVVIAGVIALSSIHAHAWVSLVTGGDQGYLGHGPTPQAAEEAALNGCASRARNCKVVRRAREGAGQEAPSSNLGSGPVTAGRKIGITERHHQNDQLKRISNQ